MNFIETQATIINILTQEKATAEDVAAIMKAAGVIGQIEHSSPQNDIAIQRLYVATLAHKDWAQWKPTSQEANHA